MTGAMASGFSGELPPRWDGRASERIADAVESAIERAAGEIGMILAPRR